MFSLSNSLTACHKEKITSMAFSSTYNRLITASDDKTMKIWDLMTGCCLQTLQGHEGIVQDAIPLQEQPRLASLSFGGFIKIWDTTTMTCTRTIENDRKIDYSLLSLNKHQFVSTSYSDIKIWNIETGRCDKILEGEDGFQVFGLVRLSDKKIASAIIDGSIKIWDTDTAMYLLTMYGHSNSICALAALSFDQLASASFDKTIKIWNTKTGVCLETIPCEDEVWSLVYANNMLIAGLKNGTIQRIPFSKPAPEFKIEKKRGDNILSPPIHRLFCFSNNELAILAKNRTLAYRDLGTGQTQVFYNKADSDAICLPNHRLLVNDSGSLFIIDTTN